MKIIGKTLKTTGLAFLQQNKKKATYGEITTRTLEDIILALTPHSNSELRAHTPIKVANTKPKIKIPTGKER